jgi:hypothetical protein
MQSDEEWRAMGEVFWNKNPLFLKFQGLCTLKTAKHRNWTAEQDALLKNCVAYAVTIFRELGCNEWN